MRKHAINFFVDGLFLLLFLGLCVTGILLQYVLPPGSGRGRSVVWGLSRHEWGSVHFWIATGAVAAMLVHLALHWSWVWASSLGRLGLGRWSGRGRMAGGLGLLGLTCAGFGLVWWVASNGVQPPLRPGRVSDRGVTAAEPAGLRQASEPRRWRGGRDREQTDDHQQTGASHPGPRGRVRAGRM